MGLVKEKSCDICHDRIGLYTPWYSVNVRGRLCFIKGDRPNPLTLCVNCYHAYEHFLIEREVQENHRQTMKELKGETRSL